MINTEQIAKLLNKSVTKTEQLCAVLDGIGFNEDQIIGILESIKIWYEEETYVTDENNL